MVSKASDDLPDPDTPVTTVKVLWGISKSMFFRLWTRAPRTTMDSVDKLGATAAAAESQGTADSGSLLLISSGALRNLFIIKGKRGAQRTKCAVGCHSNQAAPEDSPDESPTGIVPVVPAIESRASAPAWANYPSRCHPIKRSHRFVQESYCAVEGSLPDVPIIEFSAGSSGEENKFLAALE